MIILDTNVVSELMRPVPDPRVEAWISARDGADLWFTTIGEAELLYGLALLPAGRRRDALADTIEDMLADDFRGRILPFDRPAALAYATIAAARRSIGRPMSHLDCQIAAIAQTHGATIATRNTSDFEDCGIEVLNPWT